MEYYRDDDGKIQASFSLNAGRMLCQYLDQTKRFPPNMRYEGTQTICVLQSLLCHTVELLKAMSLVNRSQFDSPLSEVGTWLGIKKQHVTKYTFPEPISNFLFLEHLRNALSHPTHPEKKPRYPSTGYTTIRGKTNLIESFCFTDSPWVERGKVRSHYQCKNKEKLDETLNRKDFKKYRDTLKIRKDETTDFWQFENGEGFYLPLFIAEISLSDLIRIALELSNYLAQPTRENWDGKSVIDLVKAA